MHKNLLKSLLCVLVISLVSSFTTLSVSATDNIAVRVIVSGQEITFADQGPVIVDGRTLVPIRDVFEAIGFDIEWHEETSTVLLSRDIGLYIAVEIGASHFSSAVFHPDTLTGHAVIIPLEVPAQIIGGRTMLPLRGILEHVGYDLAWDEGARTVTVIERVDHPENMPNPIVNIRHLLRANLDDVRDLLGEQTNFDSDRLMSVYSFDSGVQLGVDGSTIMSIWLDYNEVSNNFHFDWISGVSNYTDIVAQFGSEPYNAADNSYSFLINDNPRHFVRFYFGDNGAVVAIRLLG